MQFEKLSKKRKKWLTDTARKMDVAINELVKFLKENKDRKDADFYLRLGSIVRKAEKAIFNHLTAKHKIAKTYYTDEYTKDLRLTKHMLALRIAQVISNKEWVKDVLFDWIINDKEEFEWVIS